MKSTVVEIVFVIDASESMRPCLEGMVRNLDQIIAPLQGYNFKVRFGLLAMSVGKSDRGGRLFRIVTLAGDESPIYRQDRALFTDDPQRFRSALGALELGGDENHLVAIDCALDFPFGPLDGTRRVVCLFSDEKIEDGLVTADELAQVPAILAKIMARRVQFFGALPSSRSLEQIGSADCSQIEKVQGGDGLASVNFSKLLGQMGKSMSVTSLQGGEGKYQRAIFGQDQWTSARGSFEGLR